MVELKHWPTGREKEDLNFKQMIRTNLENRSRTDNIERRKDEFESKLLDLARVVRVAAGGRRFRFRAVIVVGNKSGKVGVGVAKGLTSAKRLKKRRDWQGKT